jgi:hypothetical protein
MLEGNELIEVFKGDLEQYGKEHTKMWAQVQTILPRIEKTTENFGKTQSQFMDNMLTVSHPTPIRNLRQILAEMNKSLDALKEAYYKNEKKKVEIKMKAASIVELKDPLEKEMAEIESQELMMQLETGKKYIGGAIRKLNNYSEQYQNILNALGVKDIDEVDFEKEEEEYHIKKAFEQGLIAARSHQGIIDEGNQIYMAQLGINGTVAQRLVFQYLSEEGKMLSENREPTIEMQWKFLDDCYQKFKGCSIKLAGHKGMTVVSDKALLRYEQ